MQNIWKILGVIAAIAIAGVVIGMWGSRGPKPEPGPGVTPVPPETTHSPSVPQVSTPGTKPTPVAHPTSTVPAVEPGNMVVVAGTPGTVSTNWEDTLEAIIDSEGEDTNKVKQLYAMFPTLPAEGKEEVAQHLSNLVEDDDYQPLSRLLADPKLPEDVLDVLMADLLNRPNATKLPMFLELAFTPDHPKAEEAKDLLELYLDEDYGTEKAKWDEAMQKWLKDPDNQD